MWFYLLLSPLGAQDIPLPWSRLLFNFASIFVCHFCRFALAWHWFSLIWLCFVIVFVFILYLDVSATLWLHLIAISLYSMAEFFPSEPVRGFPSFRLALVLFLFGLYYCLALSSSPFMLRPCDLFKCQHFGHSCASACIFHIIGNGPQKRKIICLNNKHIC